MILGFLEQAILGFLEPEGAAKSTVESEIINALLIIEKLNIMLVSKGYVMSWDFLSVKIFLKKPGNSTFHWVEYLYIIEIAEFWTPNRLKKQDE